MAPHNDAHSLDFPGAAFETYYKEKSVANSNPSPPWYTRNIGESTAVGVGAAAGVLTVGIICEMMKHPKNPSVMTLSGAAGAIVGTGFYGFWFDQDLYRSLETGLASVVGSVSGSELGLYIGYEYGKNQKAKGEAPELSCLEQALFAGVGAGLGVTLKNTVRRDVGGFWL